MRFDDTGEWIETAERQLSPNHDRRPAGTAIDLLVVHGISLPPGEFGGRFIDDLFLNRLDPRAHPYFEGIHELRVSTHLLVRRDGALVQFVPFSRRAWHAGLSAHAGRERCNDFSIGVELEGTDQLAYSDAQYRVLGDFARLARQRWPAIDESRIVGHCDIAPGRKTDPGPGFDWSRLRAALAEQSD